MGGKFAYSFDRETFHGNFETRHDALQNALKKLRETDGSPEMIYIAKRVPVDPGSSCLSETVVGAMRRRVRDQIDGAHDHLLRVNEHDMAELDDEIDRVIRAWLTKHDLMPRHTKIAAIGEHPVPLPRMYDSVDDDSEVTELGESQYPSSPN